MSNFPVVIHHNPDCGTSRNVLRIIEAAGYTPVIIDYLREGWTRPQLLALFAASGLTPREALRETTSPAADGTGSRNDFLPTSPNPAITLPTTRFVTQRTLPENMLRVT